MNPKGPRPAPPSPDRTGILALAFGGLYLLVLIRTAWVCDDAYITFRTIDNFVHGHGLRWNIQDRVQVYTHPLWMFVMSMAYRVMHEMFSTSIFVSIGISLAAAGLGARIAGSSGAAALFLALLVSSKAFTDFSTSGMENPLGHLLLIAFVGTLPVKRPSPRALFVPALLACLAALNRLDALIIYAPALLMLAVRSRTTRSLLPLGLAFLPLLAWEGFALAYYGFPFPNPAYAKLRTGLDGVTLAAQGWRYLRDSLAVDPITICGIAGGVVAGAVFRPSHALPLVAGVALHLLYVVRIGGDFMSGRFLTPAFLLAAILLSRSLAGRLKGRALAIAVPAAVVLALGLLPAGAPVRSGADYGAAGFRVEDGIEDGRAYYYPTASLLHAGRDTPMPSRDTAELGRETRRRLEPLPRGRYGYATRSSIGYFGFFSGPKLHLIDEYGLADALIARLPMRPDAPWRIGHYRRDLPAGYKETLISRENRLASPELAAYYDVLGMIVRGPVWDRNRWRGIWEVNSGRLDHLIEAHARQPNVGP